MRGKILSMTTLPDQIVAEAFALSSARGADLLARLGDFQVWRGDLATMRGDNPRPHTTEDEPPVARPEMRAFLDTLVLARAIELLQPDCRATLSAVYAERKAAGSPAATQPILTNCEKRLLEIYDSLKSTAQDETMVPEWVSEREHAAVGNSGR